MALPNTITLNVGNPAGDVIFTKSEGPGNSTLYYADSPQSDLAGRPTLEIEHKKTGDALVSSKIQFKLPEYDSSAGEYVGFIQGTTVLVRREYASLGAVDEMLEMIQEVFAVTDFRSDIGEAKY